MTPENELPATVGLMFAQPVNSNGPDPSQIVFKQFSQAIDVFSRQKLSHLRRAVIIKRLLGTDSTHQPGTKTRHKRIGQTPVVNHAATDNSNARRDGGNRSSAGGSLPRVLTQREIGGGTSSLKDDLQEAERNLLFAPTLLNIHLG
ncbi:hypothetical protein NA78x_005549 [Anatilimnocola sp. NA78]|uniref:hypothetical protein n=1 Tax=Anatilimnocola sp. NA78 TaxID=3415683 RepID=UPI003CE5AF49